MSYVCRCLEGSCSWGLTLDVGQDANQCALDHTRQEGATHVVVILDNRRLQFAHTLPSGVYRLRDDDYADHRR